MGLQHMSMAPLPSSKTFPVNKCPRYDSKLSDGEAPVQELWGVWNALSLSLLLGPLWPREIVPVGVTSMGQREL